MIRIDRGLARGAIDVPYSKVTLFFCFLLDIHKEWKSRWTKTKHETWKHRDWLYLSMDAWSAWIQMDSGGFRWIQMDSGVIQMDSDGFRWIHMDSDGFRPQYIRISGYHIQYIRPLKPSALCSIRHTERVAGAGPHCLRIHTPQTLWIWTSSTTEGSHLTHSIA